MTPHRFRARRVLNILASALLLPVLPVFSGALHAAGTDSLIEATVPRFADAGFENVDAWMTGDTLNVAFENRIRRDPLEAIALAAGIAAPDLPPSGHLNLVLVSRGIPVLSLASPADNWVRFLDGELTVDEFRGAVTITDGAAEERKSPAGGKPVNASWLRVDLAVRPLAEIQLGVADDPFKYGAWLAPELTSPLFLGSLLTLQGVIELEDELDSFARSVRPGRSTVTYSGRLPVRLLGTASAGYFPGNRYGFAGEMGRYFLDGMLEVRLAGDYSGFLKFSRDVVLYSDLKAWSGVASVTHRLPGLDLVTTASGGRYLHGDLGGSLEVTRRFHEFELGLFGVDTDEGSVAGVRLTVALPARKWGRPSAVRLVTVPDFPFTYRENTSPVGIQVPLYDDLNRLRQRADPMYVRNNLALLTPGGERTLPDGADGPPAAPRAARTSLGGTTGLFNTPVANVPPDGTFVFGYNVIPAEWSYEGRGTLDNRIWYLTMGFLPRTEVTLRATTLPGESLLEDVPEDAVDRMASARFLALEQSRYLPSVAVGIDDVKGTRRFHSLYGVASRTFPVESLRLDAQISLGYGLRSLDAARYLLDGTFGGLELRFADVVSGIVEHDSEKWNGGIRFTLLNRLDLQLAYLNMETASGGLSLKHRF